MVKWEDSFRLCRIAGKEIQTKKRRKGKPAENTGNCEHFPYNDYVHRLRAQAPHKLWQSGTEWATGMKEVKYQPSRQMGETVIKNLLVKSP